jgi:hypothetical protein
VSGFEWSGEWTVTYETFRDMGLAFMAALVLIYGLIVWEFRDFAIAGLIMSPIPLTLIGIIPGHWVMGAEFTATSMIGLIALGGIIVRQSILIVEFVKIEVEKGKSVREAAVAGAEIRMRPILITSLTLMAGAFAIINDPIFQGMAVSLFYGAGLATLMAVIVIPLGCISLRKHFYMEETESGEIELSGRYAEVEEVPGGGVPASSPRGPLWVRLWGGLVSMVVWVFGLPGRILGLFGSRGGTPLWVRLWGGLASLVISAFGALSTVFLAIWRLLQAIFGGLLPKRKPKPGPAGPGSGSPPAGGAPAPQRPPGADGGGTPETEAVQTAPSTASPGVPAVSGSPAPPPDAADRPVAPPPATADGQAPSPRRRGVAAASTAKEVASSEPSAKKSVPKKAAAKKVAAKKVAAKKVAAKRVAAKKKAVASKRPAARGAEGRAASQPGAAAAQVRSEGGTAPPSVPATGSAGARPADSVPGVRADGYDGHEESGLGASEIRRGAARRRSAARGIQVKRGER